MVHNWKDGAGVTLTLASGETLRGEVCANCPRVRFSSGKYTDLNVRDMALGKIEWFAGVCAPTPDREE